MMKNYKLLDKNSMLMYGFFSERGNYLIPAHFDPWTGRYLMTGFKSSYYTVESHYLALIRHGRNTFRDVVRSVLIQARQNMHRSNNVCDFMYDATCDYDKGMTRLTYIPTIRTYAFFRKKEKGVFDALDYCPFCGAKLPERLDEKLTEILQNEYGLQSWRDYKKAPHEFHTDEWWKKRGL